MTSVDAWVNRHGWSIITGLVSILGAWFAMQAQVTTLEKEKVDKTVFVQHTTHADSVTTAIFEILHEMQRDLKQQHSFLCHGKEESLGCQP